MLMVEDFDGNTAFDLAISPAYAREDPLEQHQLLMEIVEQTLPIDTETKEKRDPSLHGYIWCRIVQTDKYVDIVSATLNAHSKASRELAYATDAENRPAINIASPLCQMVLKEFLYFLKRYEFITPVEKPLHRSATCMIVLATDHLTSDKQAVALKLMENLHQFETEVTVRESVGLEDEFVVSVLRTHRADVDPYYLSDAASKGFEMFKYCTVMPAADRNLATIISSERIAGKDWPQVKLATLHIARALAHVHEKGFIHGDIKPLNIMRIDNRYKLIDFDAGAPIGVGYSGSKFSSAYAPPEMIFEAAPDRFLVKHVSLSDPLTLNAQIEYLPYELLKASPAHDIWAFGVVLYELCSGIKLFLTDDEDNIDSSELEILYEFPDEFKKRKLERISNTYARNLVSQLLMKDSAKRPSMTTVLSHPFITGGKATRLVGDVAEFDVFISYRVKSDAAFAVHLYHALVCDGLKVWLDCRSLEPGVSWEEGCVSNNNNNYYYHHVIHLTSIFTRFLFSTSNYYVGLLMD